MRILFRKFRIEERESLDENAICREIIFPSIAVVGKRLTQKEIIAHYTVTGSIIYLA